MWNVITSFPHIALSPGSSPIRTIHHKLVEEASLRKIKCNVFLQKNKSTQKYLDVFIINNLQLRCYHCANDLKGSSHIHVLGCQDIIYAVLAVQRVLESSTGSLSLLHGDGGFRKAAAAFSLGIFWVNALLWELWLRGCAEEFSI